MQLDIFEQSPDASKKARDQWAIFFDGAARGNPGPAGAGVIFMHNGHVVERMGFYLKTKTNNQAEYLALILALIAADAHIPANAPVCINGDSQLLVRQLNGQYRVKNPVLQHLFRVACLLLDTRTNVTFHHVTRDKNAAADTMANLAIDKRLPIPPLYTQALHEHHLTI